MKRFNFDIPDSPFLETKRMLDTLVQKPELLEVLNRQQQLLDIGAPSRAMLATYSNISSFMSAYPTHLEGYISGLNTYNYLLDISAFNPNEHIAAMQETITSLADKLSVYTPRLYDTLNLSALNAFECETARILKAAETNIPFAMYSLQIADSLQALNSLHSSLLPQIDEALSSSRFLRDYTSLVERQHTQIQRDVEGSAKRLKVIEIATDIVQDQIAYATQYAENEWDDNTEISDDIPLANAKTGIQFIPTYLGYTFRENAGYDLDEEFAKSMISKILTGGKGISEKIAYINDLCVVAGKDPIFKPTTKVYTAIQCISTAFSADAVTFGCVIDSLYMLIYEGSGEAKRVLTILSNPECATLWDIKHLRTDLRHDNEHGDKKKYLAKKQLIGAAYQSICGKSKPLKQKDWVTAHSTLFDRVNEFLQQIIDKLSVELD